MINAAFVRECKPRAKMYEVTCEALPGFILRVLPTGKKVALVRYRVDGKDRREKIGLLGPSLTIDDARRKAAIMLADVASDERNDASVARPVASTGARSEQPEHTASQITTLRSLAERYIRVHVNARLARRTAERYRQQLRDVILPWRSEDAPEGAPPLGDRDFRSIRRSEINEMVSTMKDTPGAANNVLATTSSLFTWIIKDLELKDMLNPAFGIEHFPVKKRERFLTAEERQRLQAVINAGLKIGRNRKGHLHIASVWAFDLLALTGRRRDEIVTLKWEMVNWEHKFLDLPDTKGGQLKVEVSEHVLTLLRHIHEKSGKPSSGYVLRGLKGTRLRGINRTWENVRTAAGLPDVRLHDLRHSFASDALMSGVPLAVVGKMLGHKHDRTTQRYAHLANDVVRQGLEAATNRIVSATMPIAMLAPPPFTRLTGQQWKRIAPIVEASRGSGGKRTDLRLAVDGVRWVLHNGAKWRDLPAEFGPATTMWRWYERWCGDGTWSQVAAILELSAAELGREPRHAPRSAARSQPIEIEAIEVLPFQSRALKARARPTRPL
jgi:integrase/transposase